MLPLLSSSFSLPLSLRLTNYLQAATIAGLGLGLLYWFQERLVRRRDARLVFFKRAREKDSLSPSLEQSSAASTSSPSLRSLPLTSSSSSASENPRRHHPNNNDNQIYIPRIPGVPDDIPFYPDRFGLDYEDVWLSASDGTKLHAWLVRPPGARPPRGPLLIFFQENAGTMAMRLPFLRLLVRHLGCAVLAPSYRG